MNDVVKVFALGGLDENGRDCYVIEINNDIFVLDCGTSLPDKTIPGIDYLAPNPDYLIKNKDRVKAYLISHGHDESMSALKYFYHKAPAPVYCSKITYGLMVGQAASLGRELNIKMVIKEPTSTFEVAGREVRFFQTCHNTSDSSGIAIYTTQGYIVYTGDFIIDFSNQQNGFRFDLKALEDLASKEILLLMAESKSATKPGYCSPKHRTSKLIEKSFKDQEKRIFISCFWQNIYRIDEIMELCRRHNKKVFFYNEYTRQVMTLAGQVMPFLLHDADIVKKEDFLRVRSKDLVILILGLDSDLYEDIDLLASRMNSDKRIVLTENDIFINASLPRPTLETMCTRCMDKVYRTGCEVNWLKKDQLTAMHAREDDLKFFLSVLKPKYYLPVRGNFVNMMANAKLALAMNIGLNHMNVFIIDNGMQIEFDGVTRPRIIPNEVNNIPVDPVLIDGTGMSQPGNQVVSERLTLGMDGVVVMAATVDLKEKKIIAGPDCQMRGFVFVKEAEPLLKSLSNIFVDEINTAFNASAFVKEAIYELVAERCRRFIKRENGREPLILPIIDIVE